LHRLRNFNVSSTSYTVKLFRSQGWHTAPNATFPQHIIIGPVLAQISTCFPPLHKIQILTHEKRIPTKIEIFLSTRKSKVDEDTCKDEVLPDISQIDEERLGYITFDNSSKTNYSARELKSIKLDNRSNVTALKFVIHGCHESAPDNTNFQIGIVSFRLFSKNDDICNDSNTLTFDNITGRSTSTSSFSINKLNIEVSNLDKSTQCPSSLLASPTVEDNQTSNSCIDSKIRTLEELKLKKAKIEDFESAARIKNILISLTSMMISRDKYNEAMKEAANREDYVEAARWKAKRDSAQKELEAILSRAENVAGSNFVHFDFNQSIMDRNINDLSLSTIRRTEDDDDDVSSIAMTTTARSFPFDDRPIVQRTDQNYNTLDMTFHHDVSTSASLQGDEEKGMESFENGHHPLEGIPDYLNLPEPEEKIVPQGMSKTMKSVISHASSDSILKIEGILGPYRTRCFLSKNWALREAAVLKLRIIFPELVSTRQSSIPGFKWWDSFSRGMCIIVERCLEDKVVQVFLTGCIVLDDFIQEINKLNLSQKEVISLLGNLITILILKLGDSNTKVAEAAETLLMSLALTEAVGPSYVGSQVLKNSEMDMKAAKSIYRRCLFLKQLVEEFGTLGPSSEKMVDFILRFGVNHKDADAREAAKELTVQLYLSDQNIVSSVMDSLSERQVKEFNLAISKVMKNKVVDDIPFEENDDKILNVVTGEFIVQTPGRRGRGRGRGRGKSAHI
jgi:centrosomal protein CEP104